MHILNLIVLFKLINNSCSHVHSLRYSTIFFLKYFSFLNVCILQSCQCHWQRLSIDEKYLAFSIFFFFHYILLAIKIIKLLYVQIILIKAFVMKNKIEHLNSIIKLILSRPTSARRGRGERGPTRGRAAPRETDVFVLLPNISVQ